MPRATSEKLSRVHAPTAGIKGKQRESSSAGARNPLFNTERFGQHILTNPGVCTAIVDKANLKQTDVAIEIGPGTGNLSVLILQKCKRMIAFEADPRMAAELQKRVQGKPEGKRLDLVVGDFIKQELPRFDVCISNTPYQISSPLVFKLLSHRPLPRVCILMFQREFALRLVARPGDNLWNRLSANAQLYAKIDHVLKVSRNSFRPPPNVESSVVRIVPIDPPPPIKFEEFDGLTRILFQRRNKTVRANFGAKGVKEMLEINHRAWMASSGNHQSGSGQGVSLQQVLGGNGEVDDSRMDMNDRYDGDDDGMDEDGNDDDDEKDGAGGKGGGGGGAKSKVSGAIDTKIEAILQESGFADSRPAKMDVDDFLTLLSLFHKHGFHFGG